jgi:SsrA-binding protein
LAKTATKDGEKLIVKNRRAAFDYVLEDTYEAGLVLVGSEVKSLRAGKVDVTDAFVSVEKNEAWLKQLQIAPFEMARAFPHEPRRPRKLLLHKNQIEQILKAVMRGGYTVIPTRLYFSAAGRVKVEIAIAKGKKLHDKREDIARKTADREARDAMRRGRRRE